MYYCIAYDIVQHRTRRLAAKWCKQAGLLRLQRSVFTGRSDADRIRDLENKLRPLLSPKDRLLILPLDKAAWQNLLLLGDVTDKTLLARAEPSRYF